MALVQILLNMNLSLNQTQDSQSLALLDYFFLLKLVICSKMAFPLLGNSDQVVLSVSINVLSSTNWDAPFQCIAYDYFCAY